LPTTALPTTPVRRFLGGLAAVVSSLAVVAGVTAAAPADAATRSADVPYLLFASAYGTQVFADQPGVSSGPSAYVYTGCSHRVPRELTNDVSHVDTGTSGISIGAVKSAVRAYRDAAGNVVSRGVSDVSDVAVGNGQMTLELKAVHGVSSAWAGKGGRYHATSTLGLGDVALTGSALGSLGIGSQLGQVGGLLNGPVNQVLSTLQNGPVTIPGLAQLELGSTTRTVRTGSAVAGATALRIDVFASPTQTAPAAGDTRIVLGRTYARITNYRVPGIFGGRAYAAQATMLDGGAGTGRNVLQPLRCDGTAGRVVKRGLAVVNLGGANALRLGTLQSAVYGARNVPKGGATGWTSSTVGDVKLGDQLEIKAISVKTKAWRGRDGRLHRSVTRSIGSITAGGKSYPAPAPGRSVQIPGLGTIAVPSATRTRTGVSATGLRLTLLGGSAGETVVDLANAQVRLRR